MSLDGSMTSDVGRQDTMHNMKEGFRKIVDLRNVRGLQLFFGFGEERPFNLPGREQLAPRARKNAVFFATNYAVSAALVGVVTILMNPMFLFVVICLGGCWMYTSSLAANTETGTIIVFGHHVTPEQRKMGLIAVSLVVIIVFGGSILFTICTASTALATAHALLRDCPIVRNEDELGFMSSEKFAEVV